MKRQLAIGSWISTRSEFSGNYTAAIPYCTLKRLPGTGGFLLSPWLPWLCWLFWLRCFPGSPGFPGFPVSGFLASPASPSPAAWLSVSGFPWLPHLRLSLSYRDKLQPTFPVDLARWNQIISLFCCRLATKLFCCRGKLQSTTLVDIARWHFGIGGRVLSRLAPPTAEGEALDGPTAGEFAVSKRA